MALKQTHKVPMRKTDFHCVECGGGQVWQARRVLVCIECGCSFKLQIVE